MRHKVDYRKLGRATADRLQLLRNLTTKLFKYERIETTLARGKELKRMAEKVTTRMN